MSLRTRTPTWKTCCSSTTAHSQILFDGYPRMQQLPLWQRPSHRTPTSSRSPPGAAASLREGMEETLTVNRLGVPESPLSALSNTNTIESSFSVASSGMRRVIRWRDGKMVQRWDRRRHGDCCSQVPPGSGVTGIAPLGDHSEAEVAKLSPAEDRISALGKGQQPSPKFNGGRGVLRDRGRITRMQLNERYIAGQCNRRNGAAMCRAI